LFFACGRGIGGGLGGDQVTTEAISNSATTLTNFVYYNGLTLGPDALFVECAAYSMFPFGESFPKPAAIPKCNSAVEVPIIPVEQWDNAWPVSFHSAISVVRIGINLDGNERAASRINIKMSQYGWTMVIKVKVGDPTDSRELTHKLLPYPVSISEGDGIATADSYGMDQTIISFTTGSDFDNVSSCLRAKRESEGIVVFIRIAPARKGFTSIGAVSSLTTFGANILCSVGPVLF